ncbi:hypothetical protein B0H67DRAFT_573328, partial [Lasiosphaeris hirsuta]
MLQCFVSPLMLALEHLHYHTYNNRHHQADTGLHTRRSSGDIRRRRRCRARGLAVRHVARLRCWRRGRGGVVERLLVGLVPTSLARVLFLALALAALMRSGTADGTASLRPSTDTSTRTALMRSRAWSSTRSSWLVVQRHGAVSILAVALRGARPELAVAKRALVAALKAGPFEPEVVFLLLLGMWALGGAVACVVGGVGGDQVRVSILLLAVLRGWGEVLVTSTAVLRGWCKVRLGLGLPGSRVRWPSWGRV